ncbi:cold shock domain-containing protein [Streptomyces sp. NPDC029003]|uniref:cold-shock protein n=1 Tax=Streptomyces sp. NPDC029003 TaxID=3155125 RepID=UPI0033E58CA0
MSDAPQQPFHEGHVQEWHSDEGWGVLVTPSLPQPVWAHFSSIAAEGYRELTAGQAVSFTAEEAEQDAFVWCAVRVVPAGPPEDHPDSSGGPGYTSDLDITFDD